MGKCTSNTSNLFPNGEEVKCHHYLDVVSLVSRVGVCFPHRYF